MKTAWITASLAAAALTLTVSAAESVSYRYYDAETETVRDGVCTEYTPITEHVANWKNGKWYVAENAMELEVNVIVAGDAYLILTDGCKLYTEGITVTGRGSLTIYAGEEGTGSLWTTAGEYCAGIGGRDGQNCGSVIIHGGSITASGGTGAAGIGGGAAGKGGSVTIYGGEVTATGGEGGAGIGSGVNADGGSVTILGGKVTATGGSDEDGLYGGAGIGGGGRFLLEGAYDEAEKGFRPEGTATAGSIVIKGGNVTAKGGAMAAGIGGGTGCDAGNTEISGGVVNASAGSYADGIGCGFWDCADEYGQSMTVGVLGGKVNITGGDVTDNGRLIRCENHDFTESGYTCIDAKTHRGICKRCGKTIDEPHDESVRTCVCGAIRYCVYDAAEDAVVYRFHDNCEVIDKDHITTDWKLTRDPRPPYELLEYEHWYAVNGSVTINGNVSVTGDIHLILTKNASLTINGCISGGGHLYIHTQDEVRDEMFNVFAPYGKGADAVSLSKLTMYGGYVKLYGGGGGVDETYGDPIPGGDGLKADEVSVYDGMLVTIGGNTPDSPEGVRGGRGITAGALYVTGGEVLVSAGDGDVTESLDIGGFSIFGDVGVRKTPENEYDPLPKGERVRDYPYVRVTPHTGGHIFDTGIYRDNGDGTHAERCRGCMAYGGEPQKHICDTGVFRDEGNGTHTERCRICGGYGDAAEHIFDSGIYRDNGDGTHSQRCRCCTAYGDPKEHIFDGEVCRDNGDGTHLHRCRYCTAFGGEPEAHFVTGNGYDCPCGAFMHYVIDEESGEKVPVFITATSEINWYSQPTEWTDGDVYKVSGYVTINGDVSVTGEVHLLLPAGNRLTVNGKIYGDGHLYVHGAPIEDETQLVCNGRGGWLGNEDEEGRNGGDAIDLKALSIIGASVRVSGGNGGNSRDFAPEGVDLKRMRGGSGGIGVKAETVTVYAGSLTVNGGNGGSIEVERAGNGGCGIDTKTLTIYGGFVRASGGSGGNNEFGTNDAGVGGNGINAENINAEGGRITAVRGLGGYSWGGRCQQYVHGIAVNRTGGDIKGLIYAADEDNEALYEQTTQYNTDGRNCVLITGVGIKVIVSVNNASFGSVKVLPLYIEPGTTVTLKATPAEGYYFGGFSCDGVMLESDGGTATFTAGENKEEYRISAVFGEKDNLRIKPIGKEYTVEARGMHEGKGFVVVARYDSEDESRIAEVKTFDLSKGEEAKGEVSEECVLKAFWFKDAASLMPYCEEAETTMCEVSYTVRYVDKEIGDEIAEPKIVTGWFAGVSVTERPDKEIEHYTNPVRGMAQVVSAKGTTVFTFRYPYAGEEGYYSYYVEYENADRDGGEMPKTKRVTHVVPGTHVVEYAPEVPGYHTNWDVEEADITSDKMYITFLYHNNNRTDGPGKP